MTEELFNSIVDEVIRRLAERMNKAGRGAELIVVFTGATVGLAEAVAQVRSFLLDGFSVKLLFSEAAEHLAGDLVKKELEGVPEPGFFGPERWLSSLRNATAVVVPMLSLNSASKLCMLIADDLVGNVLLHALLMGKPLIMASDGVEPDGAGRKALGFDKGNAALNEAIRERLKCLDNFGCILTRSNNLSNAVHSAIAQEGNEGGRRSVRRAVRFAGQVATAGDVLSAHRKKMDLELGPAGRATPLARDLADKLGVALTKTGNP